MKVDDHPQYKKVEEGMHRDAKTGEVVDKAEVGKTYYPNMPKKKTSVALRKEKMKESFSSWRQDLSEIMTDDIDSKPIKEKKVNNKIKINPKLGEAVEEMGGELIEMTEISEYDFMVEGLRQELVDEGHDPEAVDYALEEAKVTMGHDTEAPARERTRDKLKKKVKGLLGKIAYKGYHAARDAKRAASPMVQRVKTSAKRGIRKAALKVADKLKEETVDEASYTPGNAKPFPYGKVGDKLRKVAGERDAEKDPKKRNKLASRFSKIKREYDLPEAVYGGTPPEKKDTRMTVTAADKKGNTPAYQRYKAGDKRYKAADHMGEEVVDEAMRPGPRQRKMAAKMHDPYIKGGSKSRGQAHNIAVRGDVSTGDPAIKSRGGGGVKKDKGMGYGDRGAGNKARRRAGQEPLRGTVRKEELRKEEMSPQEIALQKKKAMLDKMIANRRSQELIKKKEPTKAMGEETEDSLRDKRQERGGVDGNTNYRKPAPKFAPGPSKKKYDGMSALDYVKADIRKKHGKGAIIDTKKK
jgi:hypothetical protein